MDLTPHDQTSRLDMMSAERDQTLVEVALQNVCAVSDSGLDGYGADSVCVDRDCIDGNELIHPGAMEACNGIDDDCDGEVDELIEARVCGHGACMTMQTCLDGRLTDCVLGEPTPEVCNDIDDHCDGVIDNGLNVEIVPVTSDALTTLVGACDALVKLPSVECRSATHQFCQNRGGVNEWSWSDCSCGSKLIGGLCQ